MKFDVKILSSIRRTLVRRVWAAPHYIISADKVDWEATCCSYSFFTGQNISENENISQRERKDIFLEPIFFSVNKKPLKFNWHDPDKYIFELAEI